MAGSGVTKIDSNISGLRVSEEASLCVLPLTPVWYDQEPNSYQSDFGGEITTVSRNPINPGRQKKKSVPVDKDAAGGWNQDLTQENTQRNMRGHFFADYRERADTQGFTRTDAATTIAITNVDGIGNDYEAASGLDSFTVDDLILASGFGVASNNGVKVVITAAAASLTVSSLLDEAAPPAAARLVTVGHQFIVATVDVDTTGGVTRLTRASGTKDFTDFGLIPGEAIYIGGDGAGESFVNAVNNGRKRVLSVAAAEIVIDKSDEVMVDETGAALTIHVYLPARSIKNESDPDLQVRRFYQFERTLGSNTGDSFKQAQYVTGNVAGEFSLNLETASLATADLAYIAADTETLDENNLPTNFPRTDPVIIADAIKSESSNMGSSIVPVVESDAFNTSSDLSRIRLARVVPGDVAPTAIVGFLQSLTLSISQGAEGNKALGTFGSFEISVGTFSVGADLTGYFSDVAAITAVETAEDVTLDFWQVKNNAGIVFDLPLIGVSDGRPNVEQDSPITIPLNAEASTGVSVDSTLNHTLMMSIFDYLPDSADI